MNSNLGRFPVLVVTFLALGAGSLHAAADWPVPRGPSHEPVVYRYDAKAWEQVPKQFLDDAQAVTLHSGVTYLVAEDGTIETITHELTRFNSRKAIGSLGEYRNITYDPAYEKMTLNEARVIKADGSIVAVEPKHVQLRDLSTDFLVYDHSKQLVISWPTLEVGDVIEIKWTTRGKNPEHQGKFFTRYNFGDDKYPVAEDELRVRLPKKVTLKYAATGGKLDPEIREEGDNRTYHWRVTNRSQLPQDENAPSKEELRLQVACSTFATWDDVLTWKRQLRQDCWTCTPELKQVVLSVTKGLDTPLEKAQAMTKWVRRNIRYVSVGEKHDYTPHPPGVILGNRYGDCKDTSQLLAVMLKEAGIQVGLATLGVLDDGQVLEEVPSPWGSHAILLATIDGHDHWIDTTASLAGWDMLPKDDRNRLCYVVDDQGLKLKRTPALTADANRIEQTTRVLIGLDGSSRNERRAVYHGVAALARRFDWVEVPSGERRRLVTSELQDSNSRARLLDLQFVEDKLQDFKQPVQARMVFEVPAHFTGDLEKEGSLTDSIVWGKLLAYNLDYDREVPFEMPAVFESTHRYEVFLPPFHRLDTTVRSRKIESKWGVFELKVKEQEDERRIDIEYHTRIDKARVEPADFEEFRKFHEDIVKHYRVWLTFRQVQEQADAPLLEAMLMLTPGDEAAASVLADIYLHNDKPDDARRVVRRARYYHPDNAALGELAVKAAANLQEEEAVYRDLVKRFPDEARYVVALGENLVDQGKHEDARTVLASLMKKGPPLQQGLAHYQLARSGFLQEKYAEALKQLDAAEAVAPESVAGVEALSFKARIYEKLNQINDAIEAYKEVLKLNPEAEDTLESLIRLGLAAKNNAQALDFLRRFTVAVANSPVGLARAADYHLRLGRYEDALDLATRSRELDGPSLAQRTLGLVLLRQGLWGRAAFHLDRADLDSEVLVGLVKSHLALGQLLEAVEQSKKAEKLPERSDELVKLFLETQVLLKRQKELLAEFKIPEAQLDVAKAALARLLCAEHAFAVGRPAVEVESLLADALVNGLELGPALALRGQLALEKGKLSAALSDAERAVSLSPKEARGYYVRGRVGLERGQLKSLADLKKAAELSQRQDAGMLHWLAAALFQQGKKADALTTQREAVKLKPDDKELAEQLAQFEKGTKEGG